MGESFIVKQMLPLLKNVARSCIDISSRNKPEPVQSWNSLALIDCLMTLDGLIAFLPKEVVVKELIEVCTVAFVFRSSRITNLEQLLYNYMCIFYYYACRIKAAYMLWFLCKQI